MLRIFCLTVSLVLGQAVHADITGSIRVVDGDTFKVNGTAVRLHAIDAPEVDQMCGDAQSPAWPCGAWVSEQVSALFEGRLTRCATVDTDQYGRSVAKCTVDGRDVGEVLVSAGLAFAYRQYGLDYDLAEKGAAVNGRGLHGTGVMSPASFRQAQRAAQQSTQPKPTAGSGKCVIKGNISSKGERIYHVPGQEYYVATQISPAKGERWFCTEAEARAAGWRKARK